MNRSNLIKFGVISLAVVTAIVISAVMLTRHIYNQALRPVGSSQKLTIVTVEQGASAAEIAEQLKSQNLIREAWAFQWYVRSNGLIGDLKAGTYALNQHQSTPEIAAILAQGEVATDLVTILPGQRLDEVKAALINAGFDPKEVDSALQPSAYRNHPALVDKPSKASLEGYLYPESFQKTAETSAHSIIRASLDEMQKRLTPDLRAQIARQGLSVHEGIILASMIEKEVSNEADKKKVAGVFFNRRKAGMRFESDPTAFYGAILDDAEPSLGYDSPYNTYTRDGLPSGPISNVSASSLAAVAGPAKITALYFVAGDDGTTHFSDTLAEHEANTRKYCTKLCR